MAQPCPADPEESTPRHLTSAPDADAKPRKGRLHYRRLWLNRPGFHGRGHLLSEVHLDRNSDGVAIRAEFLLADCSRSVTIDFDMYENATAADRRNALRKARLLRESVNSFCDALEVAAAEYEADRAARRARRRPRRS
ncbi:hypothetical protein [Cryptosporangium aurantiacum]|uniref:Uncharacterized protein n=1 Tax=Cryptosporangium aurantiacum TaxID=134849 RepID=A0A1M7IAI4_9ACTN|nr:hypothetical protein [Cryptosporangium aurantiacum]SHM37782.1 hypothetical protein SAMN05443668_101442 [Cryptosporangium aurantiacum]